MKAAVYYNGVKAGVLEKDRDGYGFSYDSRYMQSGGRPISITMPFQQSPFTSPDLFPVFVNLLSEGSNKKMQCRMLKIDENDYFSLLLATAKLETIGPITVVPLENEPG